MNRPSMNVSTCSQLHERPDYCIIVVGMNGHPLREAVSAMVAQPLRAFMQGAGGRRDDLPWCRRVQAACGVGVGEGVYLGLLLVLLHTGHVPGLCPRYKRVRYEQNSKLFARTETVLAATEFERRRNESVGCMSWLMNSPD